MPLPEVIITKQAGGLGRPLQGEDHISGMLFYNDTLPSGFSTSDRIKAFFSLDDAETAGILEGSADHGEEWYQIREFFRLAPKGVLYVGYYALTGQTYDYAELLLMEQFAEGKIRQFGVYAPGQAGVTTAMCADLNTQMEALYDADTPAIALLATDISAVSDLSTLPDLRTAAATLVGVVIAQDGLAKGKALYDAGSSSVAALGAALGSFATVQVHVSIGWPRNLKPSDVELDTAAFGNGQLVKNLAGSLLDTLNDRGYIFLRKFPGLAGSYWNGAPAAVASTSDFAYLENSRTIDKAVRLVRAALVPEVNAPVQVDATTGNLDNAFIEYMKGLGDNALNAMGSAGELSGYQTIIDPEQDVLGSGELRVTIELVPVGVARKIAVSIGFKTQLSS